MSKRINRIIAITMIIGGISAMEPTKYLNLMTTKAYAEVKGANLEKISLGRGSIDFKSSKTSYTVTVDNDIDELEIRATPKEEDAEVKINGSEVYEEDNYEKVVNLDRGENTVTIKVENGSKKKTYTLTVIRGHIEEEKEIYLKSIALSSGDIDFSKETTSYDVNVNSDISRVTVKAIPEDEDYDVEINGITVNDDDNYKNTVDLANGKNTVKIKIEDDNKYDEDSTDQYENTYTLNINRGGTSTTTDTTNTINSNDVGITSTNTTTSTNQGTPSSNTTATTGWLLNNGQWYYLNESGNKQTGWKSVNNKWYYLDLSGVMKTGWQSINGNWYHLDSNGAMDTGWFKDSNGKWYYLQDSGAMAKNIIISGYKLDSTGAWIK